MMKKPGATRPPTSSWTESRGGESAPFRKEGSRSCLLFFISHLSAPLRCSSDFIRPDYVLFCNGDTYYAEDTFDSARYYLESGVGMVGMNFLPTGRHIATEKVRAREACQIVQTWHVTAIYTSFPSSSQFRRTTRQCNFLHGGVDLNGVFININSIMRVNASFAALHTPCEVRYERRCTAQDLRPYFCADWGFFYQLIAEKETYVCLYSRALYLQN